MASVRCVSMALLRPVRTRRPTAASTMPKAGLATAESRLSRSRRPSTGLARAVGQRQQRRGGADAEDRHDGGGLQHGLALGGEADGCAQRRSGAGRPHHAQHEAEQQLRTQAGRGQAPQQPAGPAGHRARHRASRPGDALLQGRNEKHNAKREHQDGPHEAQRARIEAQSEAQRRSEDAHPGEGHRQPAGQRQRPQRMLLQRAGQQNRQQGQHARRQRRQRAGGKAERQAAQLHRVRIPCSRGLRCERDRSRRWSGRPPASP